MASELERIFEFQAKALKLPPFEREYLFHDKRKFLFDFAWPEYKIAVEVDGGTYSGGRHTRGTGFHNDCIKYNLAAIDGWLVLRGDSNMVKDGVLVDMVKACFVSVERTGLDKR